MANPRTRTGGGREITTDGGVAMEGPFNAGGFPIRRVGLPLGPEDAVPLKLSGRAHAFLFQQGAVQNGSVYGDWAEMMTTIDLLPLGHVPIVTCVVLGTGPIVVPGLAGGMPVHGWNLRGGRITSFYPATGAVVLDLATNQAKLDMCFGFGIGTDVAGGGLVVRVGPPVGTCVLEFSQIPEGSAYIFSLGGGCAIDHSTDVGSFMRSPGGVHGTTMVLALAGSEQNVGLVPPPSGPLLELRGNDGAVAVQQSSFNGLPDNWLVGGGPFSGLLNIYDISASPNTEDPATWVPGFTGGGGVVLFNFSKVKFAHYVPANLADWSGIDPLNPAVALDRIAAALGPIA